jgi:hypothetical protein
MYGSGNNALTFDRDHAIFDDILALMHNAVLALDTRSVVPDVSSLGNDDEAPI